MRRITLLASTLAMLMAGSTSLVLAQHTPPPAATPQSAPDMGGRMMAKHHGDRHGQGMRDQGPNDQRGGVIGDLRGLERLYMQAGRSKELSALYNDVLAKSRNPRVRDYVYQHLARLQAQPANVDQAIATLRKSLDENLANEAEMRAEREKMRASWLQHGANPAMPASQTPTGP